MTTHRFAFHASMPAFDPNVSKTNDIIKAGPVVIHRKGLHRSKRVWMELSHDFVSSYPSAHEEDRIRPTRSIMRTSDIPSISYPLSDFVMQCHLFWRFIRKILAIRGSFTPNSTAEAA